MNTSNKKISRDIVQDQTTNSNVQNWRNMHDAIADIQSLTGVVGKTNNDVHSLHSEVQAMHIQANQMHKQTIAMQETLDTNIEGVSTSLEVANSANASANKAEANANKALNVANGLDSRIEGVEDDLNTLETLVFANQNVIHALVEDIDDNKSAIDISFDKVDEVEAKLSTTATKVTAIDNRVKVLEGRDPTLPPVGASLPEKFSYQELIDAAVVSNYPVQDFNSTAYDKFNFVDELEGHAVGLLFLNSFVPELIKHYCTYETALKAHNYAVVEGGADVVEYMEALKAIWNSDVFRVVPVVEDTAETVKVRVDKFIEALTTIHITYNYHTPIHKLMDVLQRYEAKNA